MAGLKKIQQIMGIDPSLIYCVGMNGVTRIEVNTYSPEPYCERYFYNIFKGKYLYATANDPAIAEVLYFPPEQSE